MTLAIELEEAKEWFIRDVAVGAIVETKNLIFTNEITYFVRERAD